MPLSDFLRDRVQAYSDNTVPSLLIAGGSVFLGWLIQTYGPTWGLNPKWAFAIAWLVALAVAVGANFLLKPKGKIAYPEAQAQISPAPPISINIENKPVFNNNPHTDQHPINFQTQQQDPQQNQQQHVTQSEPPAIEPLKVKVRQMFVTRLGEVTDSPARFGVPNERRPVAIADFYRAPDAYSEAFVDVRTRILFYDGRDEVHRIDNGFWFKSERHHARFQPGDTRKLVVGFFGDGYVLPYEGNFRPIEAPYETKEKYFQVDGSNPLTVKELRVVVSS